MEDLEQLISKLAPNNDEPYTKKIKYYKDAVKLLTTEKKSFNKLVKKINEENELSDEEIESNNIIEELEDFNIALNDGAYDDLSLSEIVDMYLEKKKLINSVNQLIDSSEVEIMEAFEKANKIVLEDFSSILDNEKEDIVDKNNSVSGDENSDSDESEDDLEP